MFVTIASHLASRVLRHPLFHPLDKVSQEKLLAAMREYQHPSETLLIRQGEAATHFFMVLEGRVKLFRISVDGQEKVVEIIQKGQTFAEAVMFMQHSVYPVFAQTLEPSHIISIPNHLMLQVLSEHPKSCLHLLGHLSVRLHMRLGELETLTLQNATQRFTLYLIQQLPNRAAETADIDLMLPKHLIAARLSMQPETLSRLMARLRDEGLITITGRHIHIPSISCLLARFNNIDKRG
ncbi:MAG: Crp/Fnr family transcriptional regulator [Moraxellaceae bacterium]|jgi:CRP-like cAMP-binding protein|nr:Crp/Fnr family transcriptional regulator [Moraxellaceae bacterium]HQV79643.1 Crp/Fnr family transcriptional regulator [Agitococcus sp.]MBK7300311.1 Crp/Fnr family transcriptional regulator [Moraxellaceae bacterium]MBK8327009.1 Crp/Fnr family transcriptional regulator [Moraxellaceae bacterium]MBK9186805.1 Crp/Fnr family transcriptional regulator [Moraxellaceae bacterium]